MQRLAAQVGGKGRQGEPWRNECLAMQENAVAAAPLIAHIGRPDGAALLIYFHNFAFDRVGTLWQCRVDETFAKPQWE